MPWNETNPMQERHRLIDAWLSREFTITELSQRFQVSRKTVYKWIQRYDQGGRAELADRHRAPHRQAQQTDSETTQRIIDIKHQYPHWGPVSIIDYLTREHADHPWPAPSTCGRILKDAGLVKSKRPRNRTPPYTQPLAHATHPNSVWSADFKGQFRLGNARLCYPLTLSDNCSRFLLACEGLYSIRLEGVLPVYKRLFNEYGMPDAIRTDNGYPFAQVGLGGFTPLSIWLTKLGIRAERIQPGKPQQNGRHERMHRTLKQHTLNPIARTLPAQQRAFDQFRQEYNTVRPHRSLQGRAPAQCYKTSNRPYPSVLPEPDYEDQWLVRKVKYGGRIKLFGQEIYVSRKIVGEYVGLKPMAHDRWQLFFYQLPLGVIDETVGRVTRPS